MKIEHKITVALVLITAALLVHIGCRPAPHTTTGPADGGLSYYHDSRTGLCFAVWRSSANFNSGVGLTQVECTDGVFRVAEVHQ